MTTDVVAALVLLASVVVAVVAAVAAVRLTQPRCDRPGCHRRPEYQVDGYDPEVLCATHLAATRGPKRIRNFRAGRKA